MVSGPLKGLNVNKLEVYNGEDVDENCSSDVGLRRAELIGQEISFETLNGKIECKSAVEPTVITFDPGLLYHRVLSAMARKQPLLKSD